MKKLHVAACAAILFPAMTALAAGQNPAFKQRHDNFELMGKAMKGVFDEFKKPAADIAVIRANAKLLAQAAPKVGKHFPKGTGPEAGVKTEALPAIWEKPVEFKASANRLVGATSGLQAAAKLGDIAQIKAAAGAVGASCKSCHDSFRKPRA